MKVVLFIGFTFFLQSKRGLDLKLDAHVDARAPRHRVALGSPQERTVRSTADHCLQNVEILPRRMLSYAAPLNTRGDTRARVKFEHEP
jgi:hypothetical protein